MPKLNKDKRQRKQNAQKINKIIRARKNIVYDQSSQLSEMASDDSRLNAISAHIDELTQKVDLQKTGVVSADDDLDKIEEAVHEVLIKPDPDALEQEEDTNCGSEYTDINSSSMFGGKTDSNDIVPILREMSSHLKMMANKQEDSFESFGKYVATTLRNMPERNSMELQLQIVNLLIANQNKNITHTNAGEKS